MAIAKWCAARTGKVYNQLEEKAIIFREMEK